MWLLLLILHSSKTKEFINVLNALELNGQKTLFVTGDVNKNVYLSSRNLKKQR